MGTQNASDSEFNVLQFEKQLLNLKDSQEAINNCCQWCLQNRVHHKKIVNSWLNVLKRVKVEQRLILFYLANDVVQYSKRKNFDYVESWGIALQKATTMVRDEKVKHKILRIFKIWEQRNVYNEEFISDLCGLLSVVPSAQKNDEPHEFQPNYVVNKIKACAKLEKDTDAKLKLLKEHNPKIQIDDGLITSLKDRVHLDDVEKEVEVYIKHMEDYINALKLEIKNRISVISVLKQAETQLEADRKDVKVVANAYKMFGTRVKTFQRKLEEHKLKLCSPVPSPDINAPSPSPDSDIDLPEEPYNKDVQTITKEVQSSSYNPKAELQYSSGFYNNSNTDVNNTFLSANGFSSFMGSETFNLENFNSSLFSNISTLTNSNESVVENTYTPPSNTSQNQPPLPTETPSSQSFNYGSSHVPLLPPPMPPFSKSEDEFDTNYKPPESSGPFSNPFSAPGYDTNTSYLTNNPPQEDLFEAPLGANPYPPSEEYNPEDDVTTWEPDSSWNDVPSVIPDGDTPESPPMFDKEDNSDPKEIRENILSSGPIHIDIIGLLKNMENSLSSSFGTKDVDHRNLISLTGSPGHSNSQNAVSDSIWNQADQDYRVQNAASSTTSKDRDYRLGFNIDQLKLPPPPPPPTKFHEEQDLIRSVDSPENVDMDMSDDEGRLQKHDNLKVIVDSSKNQSGFMLEPPPPLPELPDDIDANNFLDDLSNELNDFDKEEDHSQLLMPPAPIMNFNNLVGTPLIPHVNTSMPPPPLQPPPLIPGMPPLGASLNPWLNEEDQGNMRDDGQWMEDAYQDIDQNSFRGRGNNRGHFMKRGRGRGNKSMQGNNFRGNGNFRGTRGNRGGNRGFFPRGNFRGNFQRQF